MSEENKMSEEIEMSEEKSPIETIARENGWRSEDEWQGDAPKNGFKSAEDFVRDNFKIQVKQHGTIERLQGTVERVERNINDMAKTEAQRTAKALESQKKRLEDERQVAFDEADAEKFNKVDKELRDTDKQISDLTPIEKDFADHEEAFKKRNDWFGVDMVLTNATESLAETIGTHNKNLSAEDFYKILETSVKEKYPDKFRNTNRDDGSPVSGGRPKSKKKGKGFDSLSPEQKAAYDEAKYYAPTLTEDAYAKSISEMELQ